MGSILSHASETHECKQCKAPMNEVCSCLGCATLSGIDRKHKVFCHLCQEMYVVVNQNQFLTRAHNDWHREQDEKRNKMGL